MSQPRTLTRSRSFGPTPWRSVRTSALDIMLEHIKQQECELVDYKLNLLLLSQC